MKPSTAFLNAISDENSNLSRFFFVEGGGGEENSDISDDVLPRLGRMDALNFSRWLEPTKIRNERIAMLYEAYAIFGALFMSAVWIIYEWGSSKGYGDVDGNAVVDQYLIVSLLWHYRAT